MDNCNADLIGISAGFDNHIDDWAAFSALPIILISAEWLPTRQNEIMVAVLACSKGGITMLFWGRMYGHCYKGWQAKNKVASPARGLNPPFGLQILFHQSILICCQCPVKQNEFGQFSVPETGIRRKCTQQKFINRFRL